MKTTFKPFLLVKTENGKKSGECMFVGESSNDPKMLSEVKNHLKLWLDSYTSLPDDEAEELLKELDEYGTFHYDVYTFTIEEK